MLDAKTLVAMEYTRASAKSAPPPVPRFGQVFSPSPTRCEHAYIFDDGTCRFCGESPGMVAREIAQRVVRAGY